MKPEERTQYLRELAERFFLSYDMVLAARNAFDAHRHLDKDAPSPSAPAPLIPVEEPGTPVDQPVEAHDVLTHEQRTSVRDGAMDAPTVVVTDTASPEDALAASADAASSAPHTVPIGHHLRESLAAPVMYAVPWEGDERIGVLGLETALRRMGCPLSRLEIADVIDAVHGKVPLIDTIFRVVEEEQTEAALEAKRLQQAKAQEGSSTRAGRQSRRGSAVRDPSNAEGRRELSPSPGGRTGRATKNSSRGSPSTRDKGPQEATTRLSHGRGGEGLTFPEFLHVLQLPLVPEDETPAARGRLVEAMFNHMDGDGDGVLSEGDIVATLRHLIHEEGVLVNDLTVQQLAMMYPTELQTALSECDADGDGIVTLHDVATILQ